MIAVTILLIVTLAIPLLLDLPAPWMQFFAFLNLGIWCTFYIELFVKLYVSHDKVVALKRNWVLVVILVAPLFLSFRFVRISRLVSLVRFTRLQKYVRKLRRGIQELIYNIEYILITLLACVFVTAFVMWQIELRFDGTITSLPDALWWAVITITTIGYGDVIPSSPEGKVFGAVASLLGTVLFMVFVARVTTLFIRNKDTAAIKRMIRESKGS